VPDEKKNRAMNRREAINRFVAQNKNRGAQQLSRKTGKSPQRPVTTITPVVSSRPRPSSDLKPDFQPAKAPETQAPKKRSPKLAVVIIIVLGISLGVGLAALIWLSQDLLDEFPVLAGHGAGAEVEEYLYNAWEYEHYVEEYGYAWPPEDRREWWESLELTPDTSELDEFFYGAGNNVSVFFKNLDTGFTYTHNPERVFFAASLSKTNHAFYMFTLAERGYIDLNEIHYYTVDDRWGGTGVLRFMDVDTPFTTRELLGLSIRESDNAAYRMLIRQTERGAFSYRDLVSELGASTRMVQNIISQNTNAYDAGLWMYAIFNYIQSESRFGFYFKYDLMNTSLTSHPYFDRGANTYGRGGDINVSFIQADYPMARKYGWARNAFHEAAIVYAPSPYILIILSNMDSGVHGLFGEISELMQDFNYRWFTARFADS